MLAVLARALILLVGLAPARSFSPLVTRRDWLQASSGLAVGLVPIAARASNDEQSPGAFIGPLASIYDSVGAWLVEHPAPQFLVNNPVKRWVTMKSAGSYDREAVRAELLAIIEGNDVVMFSATYCPFSFAAKRALEAEGIFDYTAVEWNTLPEGGALVAEIGELIGRTSIPSIFIGGVSIGGCNDGTPGLRPLIASGGLDAALEGCSPEFRERRRLALAKSTNGKNKA
mmetsp:Transcript_57771/g.130903  ORF Transcript_57771/g.130903 Transcript_57771/m.130903 type:complete len:229 (-) Transcript_57771:62-748(-)